MCVWVVLADVLVMSDRVIKLGDAMLHGPPPPLEELAREELWRCAVEVGIALERSRWRVSS